MRLFLALITLVWLAPSAALARRESSATFQMGGAFNRLPGKTYESSWVQKARLNTVWEKEERWRLEFAVEAASLEGGAARLSGPGPFQPQNRAEDLNPIPHHQNGLTLRSNLDRLSLRLPLADGTLTLGRQAIGHGNGRYFNPSDLFSPLSPFGINTEYKSGVDALVWEKGIDENRDMGLWWVSHRKGATEGTSLFRFRQTGEKLDLSLLVGRMAKEPLLAWDLAGQIQGTAWYTEGVASFGRGREDRHRLAGGLQWFKSSGLQVLLEWSRNSAGAKDIPGRLALAGLREWQDGQVFLTGRWHMALMMSDEYQPLKSWSFLTVQDFSGHSVLLSPALQWDLSEQKQVRVGLQKGFGKSALVLPAVGALPRSDFGSIPLTLFAEIVWNL